MINYYSNTSLNKEIHNNSIKIIQRPVSFYSKPRNKLHKLTSNVAHSDEYFMMVYFIIPTIIIMILLGILTPIPWTDTIYTWTNVSFVGLLALVAPLFYILLITPIIVGIDLLGKSAHITPRPKKKYAIKTKKQQLIDNYSKPLQLINKYYPQGMIKINDLINQSVIYSFELLDRKEKEKSPHVMSAYTDALLKTVKNLENTINDNVSIARNSENYVLTQEKSIQQQMKDIDNQKIETIFEEFNLRFNND